jgi:LuxR family maltose regulon positive regulatory protein
LAQQYNSPYWLAQAAAAQAHLWLEQGQLEAAQSWAKAGQLGPTDPLDYLREAEYLTLARLLVKRQEIKEAQTLLGRMLEKTNERQRIGRIIELLIIQAAAYYQQGETEAALTSLSQALTLAQPEEYIRLFVDEGQPVAELLTTLTRHFTPLNPAYLKKLLTAFEKAKAEGKKGQADSLQPSAHILQPLVEPLSERELELLQLIATGMSNQEIAETLVVTVGTVKWHLNNIYGKLEVRSRTQAVARARELRLLA